MNAIDFAAALADWYRLNARELPWRKTRDAYHIWLSEVMLQQTQVTTVRPYYRKFLQLWPTISDLAAADISSVMKAWEGLGYYARCRNLHAAANQIVQEHGGVFPRKIEDVIALRGIGRSTAGAILTFAYAQRHPLLDANVKRVLTRLYDEDGIVTKAAVERRLWQWSQTLLDGAADPWTHNQAMMELGATLCAPKKPNCPRCPVKIECLAHAHGTQRERPQKKKRKPIPHKHIGVGVIRCPDDPRKVLVQLRPPEGLLGGLWEFPGGKQEPDEPIERTIARELREELDIEVTVQHHICDVQHAYSHFKVTLHTYWCRLDSGTPRARVAVEWKWVPIHELTHLAFPKANRAILEELIDEA